MPGQSFELVVDLFFNTFMNGLRSNTSINEGGHTFPRSAFGFGKIESWSNFLARKCNETLLLCFLREKVVDCMSH